MELKDLSNKFIWYNSCYCYSMNTGYSGFLLKTLKCFNFRVHLFLGSMILFLREKRRIILIIVSTYDGEKNRGFLFQTWDGHNDLFHGIFYVPLPNQSLEKKCFLKALVVIYLIFNFLFLITFYVILSC